MTSVRPGRHSWPLPTRAGVSWVLTATLGLIPAALLANPILVTGTEYGPLAGDENLARDHALVVVAALSVEYLVYRRLFARRLPFRRALPVFVGIHLLSWPATFVTGFFLGVLPLPLPLPIVEIVPIYIESRSYPHALRLRSRKGRRFVLRAAILANLVSWAVGAAGFAWLGYHASWR